MRHLGVLQLDSERTWRGGQNQVTILCRGLFETRDGCAPSGTARLRNLNRVSSDIHILALDVPTIRRQMFSVCSVMCVTTTFS